MEISSSSLLTIFFHARSIQLQAALLNLEKLGPLTLSVSNSRHAIVVAIITMCALGTSYGFKGLSLFCYLTLAILLLRYVRQRLSPL